MDDVYTIYIYLINDKHFIYNKLISKGKQLKLYQLFKKKVLVSPIKTKN